MICAHLYKNPALKLVDHIMTLSIYSSCLLCAMCRNTSRNEEDRTLVESRRAQESFGLPSNGGGSGVWGIGGLGELS
jgi:hypothetical protein